MICIYCLHKKTQTANSRPHKSTTQVWRRRHCPSCGRTFTTYERPSLEDIKIIRNKQHTEVFSIGELAASIYGSIAHLPQAGTHSYELARTVELRLIQKYDITSPITIGAIAKETHSALTAYDATCGLQYGISHGLIASIRRRGRPSTTATSADESLVLD